MSVRETVLKNLLMNKFGFMDSATLNGSAEAAPKPLQVISGNKPGYIEKLNAVQIPSSLTDLASPLADSLHSMSEDEFERLYKWPADVSKTRINLQRFALYHEGAHAEDAMLHGSQPEQAYTQARSTLSASFAKQKARAERHARRLGKKVASSGSSPLEMKSSLETINRWKNFKVDTYKLDAQFKYRGIAEESYADRRAASLLIPKRPLAKLVEAENGVLKSASRHIRFGFGKKDSEWAVNVLVHNAKRGSLKAVKPFEAANIYYPTHSQLDKTLRGKGLGKRTYWEMIKGLASDGKPFIFTPGELMPFNSTSRDASRVWGSRSLHRAARRIGVKMVPYMSQDNGVMYFATNMERHHASNLLNRNLAENPFQINGAGVRPGTFGLKNEKHANVIHRPFKKVSKVKSVGFSEEAIRRRTGFSGVLGAGDMPGMKMMAFLEDVINSNQRFGQLDNFFETSEALINAKTTPNQYSKAISFLRKSKRSWDTDLGIMIVKGLHDSPMFIAGRRMLGTKRDYIILPDSTEEQAREFYKNSGISEEMLSKTGKPFKRFRTSSLIDKDPLSWGLGHEFKHFLDQPGTDLIQREQMEHERRLFAQAKPGIVMEDAMLLPHEERMKIAGEMNSLPVKTINSSYRKMWHEASADNFANRMLGRMAISDVRTKALNDAAAMRAAEVVRPTRAMPPVTAIESSINNASRLTGKGSSILSKGFKVLGKVLNYF